MLTGCPLTRIRAGIMAKQEATLTEAKNRQAGSCQSGGGSAAVQVSELGIAEAGLL
jgi:hypothetical protein